MAEVIQDWQTNPPRLTYFEGDELPELVVTKVKEDLTGHDIRMFWERPGDANNLDKVATAIDLTKGQFKFTFDDADFIPGDGQIAQLRQITPSAKSIVFAQVIFDVKARVFSP